MKRAVAAVIVIIVLAASSFAHAVTDHKPRRGKHYIPANKVGTVSTEDLKEEKVEEEQSFFDQIKNDSRLNAWKSWWRSCTKSFSIDAFVDAGVSSLAGEWKTYKRSEVEGPNKGFLVRRGGMSINPVWGRLRYVKRDKTWFAEMRNAFCGVVVYKGDKSRKVVECGELDGASQAFWVGKDRFVVTSYRKMTPEMSAECEATEVGQCVAPILWLVDLGKDTVWEYRGPVVTFKKCEPNGFLVRRYPEFFVQEEAKKK
jgi:hypothetical protein